MEGGSPIEQSQLVKGNPRQIYLASQDDDKIGFCALFQKCRVLVVFKFFNWKEGNKGICGEHVVLGLQVSPGESVIATTCIDLLAR